MSGYRVSVDHLSSRSIVCFGSLVFAIGLVCYLFNWSLQYVYNLTVLVQQCSLHV